MGKIGVGVGMAMVPVVWLAGLWGDSEVHGGFRSGVGGGAETVALGRFRLLALRCWGLWRRGFFRSRLFTSDLLDDEDLGRSLRGSRVRSRRWFWSDLWWDREGRELEW